MSQLEILKGVNEVLHGSAVLPVGWDLFILWFCGKIPKYKNDADKRSVHLQLHKWSFERSFENVKVVIVKEKAVLFENNLKIKDIIEVYLP